MRGDEKETEKNTDIIADPIAAHTAVLQAITVPNEPYAKAGEANEQHHMHIYTCPPFSWVGCVCVCVRSA